jgi:hypothetical protein
VRPGTVSSEFADISDRESAEGEDDWKLVLLTWLLRGFQVEDLLGKRVGWKSRLSLEHQERERGAVRS